MNQVGLSWAYSVDEDKEILRYILDGEYQQLYKGDRVWKQMEKDQVCRSRTWQSMKNRFLKYILRHIKQPLYELTAEEIDSVKLMLPLDQLKKKSNTNWQSPNSPSCVASSRQGTDIKEDKFLISHNKDQVGRNVPDMSPSNIHHGGCTNHHIEESGTISDFTKGEELKTFQPGEKVLHPFAPDAVNTEKSNDSNSHAIDLVKTEIYENFVNDAVVHVKTESNPWLSRDRTQQNSSKRKGARSRRKKIDTIPKDYYSLDLSRSDDIV